MEYFDVRCGKWSRFDDELSIILLVDCVREVGTGLNNGIADTILLLVDIKIAVLVVPLSCDIIC